jgi:hypothetical protein
VFLRCGALPKFGGVFQSPVNFRSWSDNSDLFISSSLLICCINMSVKGRSLYGDDVSAIKKSVVRLTAIGGALIQAVTAVSLVYPGLIHSQSLSVMSSNPVRKLINKTRLNRRSKVLSQDPLQGLWK